MKNNEFCVWAVSDPISLQKAETLRHAVTGFDHHRAAGQIELIAGTEWYLSGDEFDLQRITGGWHEKLSAALAKGYDGMRVSGNAFWLGTKKHWKEFCEYEYELDRSLASQKMIVLCTYSLQASRTVDMLDVARAHQCSIVRTKGNWEFMETPELKQAQQEIRRLNGALDIMSKPFPGHDSLTPKERVALAQIIRGASSKEAARTRHQPAYRRFPPANLLKKLGARNAADLVHKVLGE